MYLEHLIDEAAASDLLEDCWHAALPEGQWPPTAAELTWFGTLLQRDAVHRELTAADRATLHAKALEIERRVAIVSGEGRVLPAPHRLYISLELAKVLFARSHSTLDLLRSVVVYADAGKLRKGQQEAGLAYLRGRNHIVRRLNMIEALWCGLDRVMTSAGKPRGPDRWRVRSLEALRKQLRFWTERLHADPHPGDGPQLLAFTSALETELPPLLRETASALAAELQLDAAAVQPFATAAQAICELARAIAAISGSIDVASCASIHLSWFAQIAGAQSPHHNVLVHELAHVLDFETGGLDGCASASDRPPRTSADLDRRWAVAYAQALTGELDVLDRYGHQSRAEFFAVSTAHYFSHASSLRDRAPGLFALLRETYGYVPADRPRTSSLGTFKTLFLSKLRTFW